MKTDLITAIRIALLGILMLTAIILLLCEPSSEDNYLAVLVTTKIAGVLAAWAFFRLAVRWHLFPDD